MGRAQTDVVVGVQTCPGLRVGSGSLVVCVPAPLRSGTHLPVPEAGSGLDQTETALPVGGGYLDLGDGGRVRTVVSGSADRRGMQAALAEKDHRPVRVQPGPGASNLGQGRPRGSRNRHKPVIQPVGVAHHKVK